jgi:HEAT repeat protein
MLRDDVEDGRIRPDVTIDQLIARLLHDAQMPPLESLYALSDLSLRDVESLRAQWPLIATARRREVIELLVEQAQEDFFLQLGRLLRVALEDSDAGVRQAAIAGLWDDEAGDLIGPFVYILGNDPEAAVRAAAAGALGAYVLAGELDELDAALAMRVEEALLGVLNDETEPLEVQCRALESIAYSGEIGVRQLIEDAYYSPYEEMRISSLYAMGRSADVRWRGLVRAELQNPSSSMRAVAAIACGELEVRAATDDLMSLLDDDEEPVRLAAIFALGRIGGRPAREALQAVAGSGFEVEAAAAEDALEEMLFYEDADGIPLYDEPEEDEEDDDAEPWDAWYDRDDLDLGSYG